MTEEGSDAQFAKLANIDEVDKGVEEQDAQLQAEEDRLQNEPVPDGIDPGKDYPAPNYDDADDPHAKERAPDYDPLPPPRPTDDPNPQ